MSGKWLGTRQEAGGAGCRGRQRVREILALDIYHVELYLKASGLSRGHCVGVGARRTLGKRLSGYEARSRLNGLECYVNFESKKRRKAEHTHDYKKSFIALFVVPEGNLRFPSTEGGGLKFGQSVFRVYRGRRPLILRDAEK